MSIRDFLSNNFETKDTHRIPKLKTRYYKTSYKKIKKALEEYCEKKDIHIKHTDDVHREIFIQTSKYHIIFSVVQVTPLESAIDMKIQTYKIMGMNKPVDIIWKLYQHFDSVLQFKGVGLYP